MDATKKGPVFKLHVIFIFSYDKKQTFFLNFRFIIRKFDANSFYVVEKSFEKVI